MRKLITLAVVCGSSTAWAAPPDPAIVDSIKTIKPADYPSANTVTLLDRTDVVFQKDGTFNSTVHSIDLVLTADGRTSAASHTLYYTKDAEAYEIKTARVIKRDGTIVDVPAKDILDTEQGGEMNIYDPQGRAKKITFQNLAVGDAVEVEATLTRKTPTRENYFNDQFAFQGTQPVLESTYTADGPATMPLTSQIYRGERAKIVSTKTKVGDRIKYTWSAKKIPQLVPEQGMMYSQEVPVVIVTTDPSWQNFSKWWGALTEKQMEATPELKAKADELVKGKTTEAEKIKALYDFVSAEIRYRGLGVGPRTGYTPRKAAETMTSRWGVCRDVSILLTTMLRTQNIKAFPVLTNVGDPVLPKIAYDGFNHAIVALPKPGGGWTYLDPTAKNTIDMLPGNEAEQSTLVSTLAGEGLSSIPAMAPVNNMGRAVATTAIAADGSMTSTVKITGKGIWDQILRSVVSMTSQDQQKQIVEQVIHRSLPEAKITNYSTTPGMDLNTPLEITIGLSVPNAAVKTGDYRLLRTVVTSGSLGVVEAFLPQFLGSLPKRKYTLDAQMTFRWDQEESVTVPAEMKIMALPNDAKADDAVSSLSSSCKRTNATKLECHRSFALKSRFIKPESYTKLRDAVSAMARVGRQPVVIGGK
jgi:transglutaminase-like putative cysteine protease